jgi:hypothetical protein
MNAELERFLDECRTHPWFGQPEAFDKIEDCLTKIYRAGDDDPKWQSFDDQIREIIAQENRTLIERWEELAALLSTVFEI